MKTKKFSELVMLAIGFFCIFYVFFWNAIVIAYGKANYLFFLLALLFVIRYNGVLRIEKTSVVSVACIFLLLVVFSINNYNSSYYWFNVRDCILPSVVVCLIAKKYFDIINPLDILKKLCIFMNIYFWLNVPIIYLQSKGDFFLMNKTVIMSLSKVYYEDHITGLIGLSGTHILTLYWVAMLSINIFFLCNSTGKKCIFKCINLLLELILMIYFSSLNDNNFFYVLCPIVLVMYVAALYQFRFRQLGFLKKFIIALIVISVLVVIGIVFIDSVRNIIFEKLVPMLQSYFGLNGFDSADSSNERSALIVYAWLNTENIFIGSGLGSIMMHYPPEMPTHFGMNDFSSLIYLGGIVLAAFMVGFLFVIANKIAGINNVGFKVYLFLLIVLLFFYSNIISMFSLTILFLLQCFCYGCAFRRNEIIQRG